MKKIFLVINLLCILLITNKIYGFEPSQNYTYITTIDEFTKQLIDMDHDIRDYKTYFDTYCMISGDANKLDTYRQWLKMAEEAIDGHLMEEYGSTDTMQFDFNKIRLFAEYLLYVMHNTIFNQYKEDANSIDILIGSGYYNCVSSSILYAAFLMKYGIDSTAVETKDHVFINVLLPGEVIDVETTNQYGFNPGEKKDFLDNFGKVTGYAYVPPKDYKNRYAIDLKKLLFIVFQNYCDIYYRQNRYLDACKLAYIVYEGRYDARGKEVFESYFNNYIVKMSDKKKYREIIHDINSYINTFDWNDNFVRIRFELLYNYLLDWSSLENYQEVKSYLFLQNEQISNLKDHKMFIDIYFYFTHKLVKHHIKSHKHARAYVLVKDFYKSYDHEDIKTLFLHILVNEMNMYNEKRNYQKINTRLMELKLEYPDYITDIQENEKIYTIHKINYKIHQEKYLDALNLAKKLFVAYPEDYHAGNALKNCYVKYTIFLFNEEDFENTVKYSDEAVEKFPEDRIIKNNYLVFFKKLINEELTRKNYSQARRILNQALARFKDDEHLNKTDRYLTSINY